MLGCNPQAWACLKACRVCADFAFPVLASTSPNPIMEHKTFMHVQHKSWKAAGLEQEWDCAIFLLNGAKWCQNG